MIENVAGIERSIGETQASAASASLFVVVVIGCRCQCYERVAFIVVLLESRAVEAFAACIEKRRGRSCARTTMRAADKSADVLTVCVSF